ncbi:MAG: endonuclease III [Pseudomonadota bacterium]
MPNATPSTPRGRADDLAPLLDEAEITRLFERLKETYPARELRPESVKAVRDPFRSCVSCLLSAQSLDRNTAAATSALFAIASTPQAILALGDEELIGAIRPAGLYNMKAKNLRRLCAALLEEHDGVVPRTREGLMSLPGIGRKCADIVLHFTFHEPICAVDTHVHRVCNRVGLARGKTEEQTAKSLEPRIPDWAAWDAHVWLITWAKRVCTSRAPKCEACLAKGFCRAYAANGHAPLRPAAKTAKA